MGTLLDSYKITPTGITQRAEAAYDQYRLGIICGIPDEDLLRFAAAYHGSQILEPLPCPNPTFDPGTSVFLLNRDKSQIEELTITGRIRCAETGVVERLQVVRANGVRTSLTMADYRETWFTARGAAEAHLLDMEAPLE